ncbi:MAG: hypothetical protein QF797_02465 [Alphaproteobacteria bacterium]|nr:hypothetical protein [Alphaproteobacteria bacterium]
MSVLIIVLAAGAVAANASEQYRPPNEIPMYGRVESPAQARADQSFLEAVRKTGRSFEDASDHAAMRGWQALKKGDLSTAMKRLNQAWLLNKENGGAYWGFAIVVMERDQDFVSSEKFFRRALELIPNDTVLIQDFAKTLGMRGADYKNKDEGKKSVEYFMESIKYYEAALKIDDKADKARAGIASNYWNLKKGELAFDYARTAIERNEGAGFFFVEIVRCLLNKGIELRVDPSIGPPFKECAAWAKNQIDQ